MPFTPAFSAGDVLTAAQMNSIGEAWSTYGSTASFTAVSGGLNLGSGGTWSANYCQINKVVFVRGRITWGSTGLNLGTGKYRIALPVTAKTATVGMSWGTSVIVDNGNAAYASTLLASSTSSVAIWFIEYYSGTLLELGSDAKPFTPNNGDWIDFNFTYEAA